MLPILLRFLLYKIQEQDALKHIDPIACLFFRIWLVLMALPMNNETRRSVDELRPDNLRNLSLSFRQVFGFECGE